MAAIAGVTTVADPDSRPRGSVRSVAWTQINEDDTGAATGVSQTASGGVLIAHGTFNGGELALEGSQDGGETYAAVLEPDGETEVVLAAVGVVVFTGVYTHFRIANDAQGTSEDVDVTLVYA